MESIKKKPDVSLLRKFIPLNEWSNRKLEMLAETLEIKHAKTGENLVEFNSDESLTYYLVTGKVQLKAVDGKERTLDSKSPHAAAPLSQLLPHKIMATCLSPVKYISIESNLINLSVSSGQLSESPELDEDLAVNDEIIAHSDSVASQLALQLQDDLKQDQLNIPSLPEIATRVGRAIEDKSCNAESISRIIQTDPAITAKIVKAANSAFYGGHTPVETCSQAVIRLGMNVTHSLVVNYTMQDLFQTKSKAINLRMHRLWIHSIKVAAICYVLAKRCKAVNPDEAMAIGLLHDIGVAAILNQASKYPALISDPKAIDSAINELRSPFGSLILHSWRFSDSYISAAEEAENWMREIDGPTDYCDIVILAQLHSYVGSKTALSLPPLDQVPAVHRLALGPKKSIAILKGSNEEIEQTRSLLIQ
jgi:HD-like signal output (HDOD) protein